MSGELENMSGSDLKIVLLGKTGVGKSSVGNTILGGQYFEEDCSSKSVTQDCLTREKEINGRKIIVVDTPGMFDTDRSEKDLKSEIVSCLVECAPGPHVIILVLRVGRYTNEDKEAVRKLIKWFKGDVLKHMIVLFTHGNELKGKTINTFVEEGTLKELVKTCGERVLVIDNEHWNKDPKDFQKNENLLTEVDKISQMMNSLAMSDEVYQELQKLKESLTSVSETEYGNLTPEYRDNSFQMKELMKTIHKVVRYNEGNPYTNETLLQLGEAIEEEVQSIKAELEEKGEEADITEIRRRARERVRNKITNLWAGVASGILLGAMFGVSLGATLPVIVLAGLVATGTTKAVMYAKKTAEPKMETRSLKKREIAAGATAGVALAVGVGAKIGVAAAAAAGAEAGWVAAAAGAEAGVAGAGLAAGVATGIGAGVTTGVFAICGAVGGGIKGAEAAKRSDNPAEAAKAAAKTVTYRAGSLVNAFWDPTQIFAKQKASKLAKLKEAEYEHLINEE